MALKIITDSASDVPEWVKEEYDFQVIPTPVVIGGEEYLDGLTIEPDAFYNILKKGADVKTYHINAHMFYKEFKPYAKADHELIYICFSTGIAGTFNAANIAKECLLEEFPDFKLTIIDSKCASLGFGLTAYRAAVMLRQNCPKDEIIDAIEFNNRYMEQIFTVETLEYLYKGGRLSRGTAIAGGLLDIKPILKVDDSGALTSIEKVRGRQKSLKRLVQMVGEKGAALDKQVIGLVHGADKEALSYVKEQLKERYGCRYFLENYIGCAVGAHTGPGIIGITFLGKESPYEKYMNGHYKEGEA